jgi:type I restriction-modification system DNA methylase subunit
MEGIPGLLNQVWTEFRKGGVTDDIAIIGQVADILLTIKGKSGLISQNSTPKSEVDRSRIEGLMQQAVEQNNGEAGDLFDRYVLFRLDQMLPGGRYPTPRHIVQFMVALADTEGKQVADFACGSGGLLIHSEGSQLTGAEISPEWAQLAQANASLHDKPLEIRTGNALRVIHEDDTFERVLMNPPFGEKIKSEFGSRSETALSAFALNHLAEDGRAVLLAPSGLLFSGSPSKRSTPRKRSCANANPAKLVRLKPSSDARLRLPAIISFRAA